jgi:potassium efflux system protein
MGIIATLILLLLTRPSICQESPTAPTLSDPITTSILEAKIQEVEAATGMEQETKSKLIELYRKALSHLQTADSHAQLEEAFRRAAETAPAAIRKLREQDHKSPGQSSEASLELPPSTPLPEIEQRLRQEKANLISLESRRSTSNSASKMN